MNYTYKYPDRVQVISGRRCGHISISEEHLAQTHEELMNRIDDPDKMIAVRVEINADPQTVWNVAARTVRQFFSHHPRFAGLTYINSLGSDEGGRYVVHHTVHGGIIDRTGEVLINIPWRQLTASNVDIADPSVSGLFQSLYSIKLYESPDDPSMTEAFLSYTMLSVAPAWVLGALVHTANNIKRLAEVGS
jgi:hypothetical protein